MSERDDSAAAAPGRAAILLRGLRRLLRPLVRLLIAHQVTYPQVAELLKELYASSARDDFPLQGRRQTDSRISLLTGLHRKDVKRLRTAAPDADWVPASVSLGSQIALRWNTDAAFLDDHGRPRPLPRRSDASGAPSFEDLVRAVNTDIRPRGVLDEWLRLGVVELDADDRVCLHAEAFVPKKAFDEKAYYMGRNLHDHIAAAAHNLQGEDPPFVERNLHYGSLTPGSVAELSELSRELGMKSLLAINRRADELKRRDAGQPHADRRMSFGIYFFEEASQPADTEDDEGDT